MLRFLKLFVLGVLGFMSNGYARACDRAPVYYQPCGRSVTVVVVQGCGCAGYNAGNNSKSNGSNVVNGTNKAGNGSNTTGSNVNGSNTTGSNAKVNGSNVNGSNVTGSNIKANGSNTINKANNNRKVP